MSVLIMRERAIAGMQNDHRKMMEMTPEQNKNYSNFAVQTVPQDEQNVAVQTVPQDEQGFLPVR